MSFRILNANKDADLNEWLRLWQNWPGREVWAHPNYVRLFAGAYDDVLCAAWETPGAGVLFPIIRRFLSGFEWAEGVENPNDLTSAYGYGGPFSWNCDEALAKRFWRSFEEWAQDLGVVSCFSRLSLFDDQMLWAETYGIEVSAHNVVRRLNLGAEEIWRDYEHKVRKNIQRARRDGVSVSIHLDATALDEFIEIYRSTMDRRAAGKGYYFSRDFFCGLAEGLRSQFAFFNAKQNGRIISTELVLVSERHIYSFLGGTLAEAFPSRPNDLLKHEIITWGQREDKQAFVLGGGYGGNDGIFRYKLSFAPQGEVPFRVMKRIHDPDRYQALVSARRNWEALQGRYWQPNGTYFPAYRA